MVQGFLKTLRGLGEPISSLHKAAYLLAGLTLVSQLLALARDRIFAHAFGASATLDLYYAAFRIPDLVFALVASLVSAYVLIPRIAGAVDSASQKLLSHAASFLVIGGGLVSLALAAAMPYVLPALFPEFAASPQKLGFILLAQMLMLQPILLGLSGILTSVTQVKRRFFLFALSPVLYNLGIIAGALLLYPMFGLPGIGAGVVLGAFAHLVLHIPIVMRAGVFPKLVAPSPAIVWSIVRDSVPRSLALSSGALTALLLTILASRTAEGGVSVLALAGNLEAVPLALIGASYATAAFPVLSEEANGKRDDAFKATLSAAGRHLIFWSSVAAILIIVLRAHLVRVILGTGAFDWEATRLTAALLGIMVVGLSAQGIVLLASRAFYAARKSWNPLFIQAVGLMVSLASALLFLGWAQSFPEFRYFVEAMLRIEDAPAASVVFIALGATLGQIVMGVLALLTLRSVAPGVASSFARPLFEGAGAGIVGGAAAYGTLAVVGTISPLSTLLAVFTQGFAAGMVGLAVSASVLILLENREFKQLYESLRKKGPGKALQPSGTVLNDQTHS